MRGATPPLPTCLHDIHRGNLTLFSFLQNYAYLTEYGEGKGSLYDQLFQILNHCTDYNNLGTDNIYIKICRSLISSNRSATTHTYFSLTQNVLRFLKKKKK